MQIQEVRTTPSSVFSFSCHPNNIDPCAYLPQRVRRASSFHNTAQSYFSTLLPIHLPTPPRPFIYLCNLSNRHSTFSLNICTRYSLFPPFHHIYIPHLHLHHFFPLHRSLKRCLRGRSMSC